MKIMKNNVTNSCGNKRGCEITLLPSDKKIDQVLCENYKVYILVNPENGDIKYVGITNRSLLKRLKEHIRASKYKKTYKDNWIQSLLSKGIKPEIELIDEVQDYKFWEPHYIFLYRSWGFKLTNLTQGGDNGILSLEARKKISNKLKGNSHGKGNSGVKRSVPSHWIGIKRGPSPFVGVKRGPISEKHRINLSKSHIGIGAIPVIQYDLNNNFIREWDSITGAASALGIRSNKITMVCKGQRNHTGGYVWKYKN